MCHDQIHQTPDVTGWKFLIPSGVWVPALMHLREHRSHWVSGTARTYLASTAQEILVEGMQTSAKPPDGYDRPQGDCWYVLCSVEQFSRHTIQRLLEACRPRPSQLMVLIVLDVETCEHWAGLVAQGNHVSEVSDLDFIGPGGTNISSVLSRQEDGQAERYSRVEGVLGSRVMGVLRDSVVTLVGAGRMGTLMAWQMAALGCRRLRLVDPDVLEIWNLDTLGLSSACLGEQKVQALAEILKDFRPDLEITLIDQSVKQAEVQQILRERCSLLVTATDDDLARYVVSMIARERQIPHLDAASRIVRDENGHLEVSGDARLLLPGSGCTRCVGGYRDPGELRRRLVAPHDAIETQPSQEWHEQRAGSLVTINQMVSGAAGMLWLEMLQGTLLRSAWQRLAWDPQQGLISDFSYVGRGEDCPICLFHEKLP